MDVPVVPPKNASSVRQASIRRGHRAIAILSAAVLISYMDRPVAHAQVDATTAVHFLEQASFGPTALEVTRGAGPRPGGVDRPADGHAREPASRRPRWQRRAGAALPQHGHRARPAAPAGHVRAQPDHRGLGQQGDQRRGADAVGAAAVAQRLRQLPPAAARGLAQPDDGQVPRQRLQPQGDRDHLAQRELRARAAAAVLDRHLGPQPRRQPEARRRRPADPQLQPGDDCRLRARAHRLDLSAAARADLGQQQPGVLRRRGRPDLHRQPPRHRPEGAAERGGDPARHDRGLRPRSGDRQHLHAPQHAALRGAAHDPLARHEQPEPGLRDPGRRTPSSTTAPACAATWPRWSAPCCSTRRRSRRPWSSTAASRTRCST